MSDDDKKPAGNAALLAQLSELQELEIEYGRETTAKFLTKGLKRSLDLDVSNEKSEGFLEVAQALQRGDARIGYIVKNEENKAARAAAEISQKLQNSIEEENPVDVDVDVDVEDKELR